MVCDADDLLQYCCEDSLVGVRCDGEVDESSRSGAVSPCLRYAVDQRVNCAPIISSTQARQELLAPFIALVTQAVAKRLCEEFGLTVESSLQRPRTHAASMRHSPRIRLGDTALLYEFLSCSEEITSSGVTMILEPKEGFDLRLPAFDGEG